MKGFKNMRNKVNQNADENKRKAKEKFLDLMDMPVELLIELQW